MRKSITALSAAAILLALAIPVVAGGFYIVLGNPDANAEARSHNAALTIKAAGCHEPEKATITATAIGLVKGERQSISLKVRPLSEPGMYSVARQWPAEGRWVLQFVGTDHDRVTSTLVAAGPSGVERGTAVFKIGQPAPADVAALLEGRTSVARK